MALVWSSEVGRVCPACGKPEAACRCPRSARAAASGKSGKSGKSGQSGQRGSGASAAGAEPRAATPGRIVVRLEKKGRAGKAVTVIEGWALPAAELARAAKELKTRAGTGGTVRDGAVELQGDQVELARTWLREMGYSS